MRIKKSQRWMSLVLALCLAAGMTACSPAGPSPSSDSPESVPIGHREKVVSLNGQWDLYADTIEKVAVAKNGVNTGTEQFPLTADIIRGTVLTVKELPESAYYKVRAYVKISSEAVPADGQSGTRLGVRINGGNWVYTDVSYYMNDTPHWVDLSLQTADLKAGDNTVELCSTMTGQVYLLGDSASAGKAFTSQDGTKVQENGLEYGLQIKSAQCGSKWTETSVPAAAEKSITLSHMQDVRPDNYNGVVWYRRSFTLENADNQDWWLCFDAVDYRAEVWLNGWFLGSHEGGYTRFEYCLSTLPEGVLASGENKLVVRVVDQDWNNGLTEDDIHIKETLAGFVQDTRKLNYSGIWQNVYLEARGTVMSRDVIVETIDTGSGTIQAGLTLVNPHDASRTVTVKAAVTDGPATENSYTVPAYSSLEVELPQMAVSDPHLWTADDPHLYTLTVTVTDGESVDTLSQKFGIRTVQVQGTKVLVNGEAVFLTGMLHWGSYYDNYTPAVTMEQVRKEITALKEDGFNAIKYCLLSPPDYILELCDELGMYVYIEYPIWNVTESEAFFERAYLQMMEMVIKDRRFASVIMTDFNCEDLEFTPEMDALMKWCVDTAKEVAPNRLYTDNSSNGEHRYGDFATCHPYYQVNCYEDMLQGWIEKRGDQPLILGEFADISVLRDLGALKEQESPDYSWYHDYYKDYDQAAIMGEYGYSDEEIDRIIGQSVLNAQELRKYYLEASKQNNHVAGLFLTHIFESPNGWADGWFDDLGEKHFDPEVIRPAASEIALLFERDTLNYWAGRSYTAGAGLSLYGGTDLSGASVSYALSSGGQTVDSGTIQEGLEYENGKYYRVGDLPLRFPESEQAVRYTLTLTLTQGSETITSNSWDVWAYPAQRYSGNDIAVYDPHNRLGLAEKYPDAQAFKGSSTSAKVVVATEINASLLSYMSGGGRVVYAGQGSGPIQAVNNWDYNRLSFAYLSQSDNPLTQSLQNLGYGGLQFLELATQWHLEGSDTPQGNLIGRYATTLGTIGSYLGEYPIGEGILLQTTLRLDDEGFVLGGDLLTHESLSAPSQENVLGAYLLDQMIRYLCGK